MPRLAREKTKDSKFGNGFTLEVQNLKLQPF